MVKENNEKIKLIGKNDFDDEKSEYGHNFLV